jgi:hypothetical protein
MSARERDDSTAQPPPAKTGSTCTMHTISVGRQRQGGLCFRETARAEGAKSEDGDSQIRKRKECGWGRGSFALPRERILGGETPKETRRVAPAQRKQLVALLARRWTWSFFLSPRSLFADRFT